MNDDQFTTFLKRFLDELEHDCDREVERALAGPVRPVGAGEPCCAAERIAQDISVIAMSTLMTALAALGASPEQCAFAAEFINSGCIASLRKP